MSPLTAGILIGAAAIIFMLIIFFRQDNRAKDYDAFLEALGSRESGGDYQAKNQFGYLGKYQMGSMALQDAGFLDEDGDWTALAAGFDIHSEADFLASAEGQEAAIRACHRKICQYIRHYGLEQYLGKKYCGVKVTPSGLLAACHLVGAKRMQTALRENAPAYDGNHVPAAQYMELFAGFDVGFVWEHGAQ